MLTENTIFAERYELIRLLGRGGFSEVWLAKDIKTGVEVALKVYAPGQGLDDAGISLFTQEFSLVFDLNHTNLLRPTYFDCWQRMPFLILPFCKNGSAFAYVAPDAHITEDQCWRLLHDVAAGLAYLHEKNPPVIHQDIKPDNILISDEGEYMITDFGISSRVRSTMRANGHEEQSGGTLAYMGPERFSPNPKPIMASDIWSLGAMMYELMTKDTPFGNHGGVLQMNGAAIPLIHEDFSEDLKNIVYKCMAADPWERPSARTLAELTYAKLRDMPVDINATLALTGKPSSSTGRPGGISYTNTSSSASDRTTGAGLMDKFKAKPKLLYGILAAVVVVIIGVLIAVFVGGDAKTTEPPTDDPEVVQARQDSIDAVAESISENAVTIARQADDFRQTDEEWFDAGKMKIEEEYIRALGLFDKAIQTDGISDNCLTHLRAQRQGVADSLQVIYSEFERRANNLKDLDPKLAEAFRQRMQDIEPYLQ